MKGATPKISSGVFLLIWLFDSIKMNLALATLTGSEGWENSTMRNYVEEGERLGLEGMAFLHYIQEQEKIGREQLALYYQRREEQRRQ